MSTRAAAELSSIQIAGAVTIGGPHRGREGRLCMNRRDVLEDLVTDLEAALDGTGAEWSVKLNVATDCCWSCEVRITSEPNAAGCARSLVSFAGGGDAQDVARRAIEDALKTFQPQRRRKSA